MCLLITQLATAPSIPDHWLEDFYSYNPDGAGVMYVEDGRLQVHKVVPTCAEDFIKLFRDHADGRECAIHLRWRTHGDINNENTHPYEVFGEDHKDGALWMMHNGVLATGNAMDTTKSDTWHFIRDYLRPMLEHDRRILFTYQFQEMLGKFIGNNRFTFLDASGQMVTINEEQGVRWGGRWMSNTYAWSAPLHLETKGALKITTTPLIETIAEIDLAEIPERPTYGVTGDPTQSWRWSDTVGANTYGYEDEYGDYVYAQAEALHEEIGELGLSVAFKQLDENVILDAITYYGEDVLWELVYQAHDGYITEQELVNTIRAAATEGTAQPTQPTHEQLGA
ncbi:hypothetical protein V757_10565 [Pelistega indica]|uniref:Glutamine amidotransferase type-2 domain-containing protein n=2 Tax=Pelistega indica TaxID=1414851 RepID=V8FVD3_9BURK|nr:hypothetical protein V757_10565 [Pelistega indica]